MGKLPFPRFLARTPVRVILTKLSEDGEPVEELLYHGLCIYNEKSRQVLDAERRLVRLMGTAIIEGDICPGQVIEGYIEIDGGIRHTIFRAARPRNPGGSVYSTELELI